MNIGIDLGTTNSALAFIDPKQAAEADYPKIDVLDVPQYIAQGRVEPRRTLPSFLYLGDQEYIGVYAREQGALVPTKSVHSAKSWLSNPEVDRTAKILPWDAQDAGRVLSPVEVSTKVLAKLADAWKALQGSPIGEQNVVLTVPASFDEEARELTVMAAREAGIENLTLLEEPAAAFYSWIANDLARSQKSLFDGQTVLVCDVGGGTSDFTLIRVSRENDRVDFTRTAVGKHLLLGGDNLDLTLTWLVEAKLGKTLSIRQRSGLRRGCASAKEQLLSDPNLKSVEVTVLGGGSSLVGGTLKTQITREEVLELALDGFLPGCELTDKPKDEDKSLYRELGLPVVSDPAVTRHLASFLHGAGDAKPDAILFNGGFFIPEILRQRVADVLEHWCGRRPVIFENRDLDLAVAVGAAYYSYVRETGAGLLVRGGLPRAYFIGIAGSPSDNANCDHVSGSARNRRRFDARSSIPGICNCWRTSRCHFNYTVRGPERRIVPGDLVEFSPEEREGIASACSAQCRAAIRQDRGAAGSRETGRSSDGSRNARNMGGFERDRASLAIAVRTAQGCRRRIPWP